MKQLVAYVLGLVTVAGWLAADIGDRRAWPPVHAMAGLPMQGRDAGATERRAIVAKTPGVDLAGMDRSVAPGDNFWVYANGAWDKATAIPADRSSYGVDSILVDEARNRTVALIQESARGAGNDGTRKIGDFYASFMDEAGIEAKGLKPVKPELEAVSAISDKRALARALGGSLRSDVDPLNATNFYTDHLFGLFVAQALDDPSRNVAYLLQGGLGMPDREYYLSDKPQMAELRTKYQAHVAAMLKLAGAADADARTRAARIYALEKRMALVHATRVESEDVHGVIAWKREELSTRAPGLDWAAFLEAAALQKESPLLRLAPEGHHRPGSARRQRAARRLEGLAHVSHDRARGAVAAQGLRRGALRVLRQGAQRHAAATRAMEARRRLHQRRPRRGGRQALRATLFFARGEGEGAGDV